MGRLSTGIGYTPPAPLEYPISISTVDTHVKERLTGAIILVGVLVLLVPELLTGPKRDASPERASGDEPPLRSYTIELNDDAHGGDRATTPPAITEPAQPQPMGAAPNEAQTSDDAAQPVESGEAAAESASSNVVDEASTSAASTEAADPEPASAQPVKPEPAKAAGPVEVPKAEAPKKEAQKDEAKKDEPKKPVVVAEAPKPASAASKPAAKAGYSIQVGSFVSRANAERLASELKGKGFSAFVSEGRGNGRKLFRVRVGPEPDKASAQALGAKLRAAGRAGSLVAEH